MSSLRKDLLIALAILFLTGPLIQEWSAQPASRYALTAAAVDDSSLELDPYEDILGIDQATYRGHIYSDKAPYQPLIVAPAYKAFRLLGGHAFPNDEATVASVKTETHRGLWWVTLWSSTLPAIALAIVMRRTVARTHPRLATPVAVAMAFGTLLLPFSSLLFGHVLGALWVAAAWALLRRDDTTDRMVGGAGLCLGMAIGTEYSLAVIALLFLVVVALTRNVVHVVALSVGTVVATLPLLLYNYLVFEDPFEVSYQGHLQNFQGEGALGVYNLTAPQPGEVFRALLSDKGLFVLTPVMILAVVGCVIAIRERTRVRRDGWVALASLGVMLLVSTGVDGLGGDTPGPRYLIPVLPLFAIPLAEAWKRVPALCAGLALVGAIFMTLATLTKPLEPAVQDWTSALIHGDFTANVLTGHDHTWLALLTTAAAAGVVAILLRGDAANRDHRAETAGRGGSTGGAGEV